MWLKVWVRDDSAHAFHNIDDQRLSLIHLINAQVLDGEITARLRDTHELLAVVQRTGVPVADEAQNGGSDADS